jgi:hypothetical protein
MFNPRTVLSIFLVTMMTSAFSAPRPNQVLIDIARESIELAQTDTELHAKLTPLLGNDMLKQKPNPDMLAKISHATLEQVRDSLTPVHRRTLIVKNLNEFFNLNSENDKLGTIYYADKLDALSKTTNNADNEAVQFEQAHKGFCSTFAANANTNALKLGLSLKTAYEKIDKNNPTKAAVKGILLTVEQNKLRSLYATTRRIKNNSN